MPSKTVTVFRRAARYVDKPEIEMLRRVEKRQKQCETDVFGTYRLTVTPRYVTLTLTVLTTYRATHYAMQQFANDMYYAGWYAGYEARERIG